MLDRPSWKSYDVEILERTISALDAVAQAKDVSLAERFEKIGLRFEADGKPVDLVRRSVLFSPHVHIHVDLEDGQDKVVVVCPCDMPAPATVRDGDAVPALSAAVAVVRQILESTIVMRYCGEYSNETAAVTDALRIHLARFLATPRPRPLQKSGSVVATGMIPFDRPPEVSIRLPEGGRAIRLRSADGRPALPLPSFRHVLDITCYSGPAGARHYHVTVIPVSTTASMGKLPSDPIRLLRLLRDDAIPNLVEIG